MSLKQICGVTVSVPDLSAQVQVYRDFLGLSLKEQGAVSADQARAWGTPDMAGAACAVLSPAARPGHEFRMVERGSRDDFVPFRFHGWNALEIVVQDVDGLAIELADSPFEILGPPDDLSISDQIRAMQVVGPAGELLYLTQIKGPVPGFDLPMAHTPVEHTFVTILGGPDMDGMKSFYSRRFGLPDAPAVEARVTVLSRAFDLPREHYHPIAAVPLGSPGFLLELDQMPAEAGPRPINPGQLAPGISMVSYAVDSLEPWSDDLLGPPAGRAGCMTGAVGELIELVETPA